MSEQLNNRPEMLPYRRKLRNHMTAAEVALWMMIKDRQLVNFINSDQYQVIILGHSCGNSDRTLLNTLFEHENSVSIKPYYYQYEDEKTGEIKDNYSDIVRNISRSFSDKKSMRDKVVNKTYTTWFSQKI